MQTVKIYARRLELLSKGLMLATPVFFCIKWFHDKFPLDNDRMDFGIETMILREMPIPHRLLGMLVDSVSAMLLMSGLLIFMRLMQRYQAGEIFSTRALGGLEKLSKYAFVWAVYSPLSASILSVVTTLHNPPGSRMLTIGFGMHDIANIFIFGCLCVIASVMREGNALQSEQDLTV